MLCYKLPPNLMAQNSNAHYLMISDGQDFGNALSRWFWLMVSHEVATMESARDAVI